MSNNTNNLSPGVDPEFFAVEAADEDQWQCVFCKRFAPFVRALVKSSNRNAICADCVWLCVATLADMARGVVGSGPEIWDEAEARRQEFNLQLELELSAFEHKGEQQ